MSKFTDSPADVCDDAFKSAYATTYAALHNAKSRFDRTRNGKRAMALSIDSLQPKQVRTCPFWNVLPVHIQTVVKMIYDVSITGRAGLVDTLYHSAVEYGTCSWVAESGINKYHICDLEQKGGITAPMDDAGWGTLANLVVKLVEAKKLSVKANKKGDAHGTMMAKHMREAVERDDPVKMGEFMGCMMWMMETPQMNRSMVPNRSSSQGFEYVWNSSTILCRVLPKVEPVVEAAEEPKVAEEVTEPEKNIDTELAELAAELALDDEEW